MADSKKTKRSSERADANKRPSRKELEAALGAIYAGMGEDPLGVRQAVHRIMAPVGESGRPAGLLWYAPLTMDRAELADWARGMVISFIGNATIPETDKRALLGWRGLVEIRPAMELQVPATSRGPVRTISSMQQLLDGDEAVLSRLVGGPVREAFAAMERRKAFAEKEARKAEAEARAAAEAEAEAARLEREEAQEIEALLAEARAQLEDLKRREALRNIMASYQEEIEAAKATLAQRRKAAEEVAKKAAEANRALLASAGVGRVREAMAAGNEPLAAAWAAYTRAKSDASRAGALESLMRLDDRLQSEAVVPSSLERALRGDCRGLLNEEVRDAALLEFAGLSEEASTIPAMRKAGEAVPGFIAPAKGAKKAKVEEALNWFARLHQELVEARL